MGKSNQDLGSGYTFKIFDNVSQLPPHWDELASSNIFLSVAYLKILEVSAPSNMVCHYIGLFSQGQLCAIVLTQFLDLNQLESYGDRDKCLKTTVRNFVFRNFSSHVLFIGNNMLTGQNAYSIAETANQEAIFTTLKQAVEALKARFRQKGIKVHMTTYKDFDTDQATLLKASGFDRYYEFTTQPNMVFDIPSAWESEHDYIAALSKKYRDQYKRARKKAEGIIKRKLQLQEIIEHEATIYALYYHVAKNAPFNTFFLAPNHFRVFKEVLKDKFLFYGYFLGDKLVGFNTLIKNGTTIDTYFLGYDQDIQKEKMLYLNMLYDMTAYSINKGFKKIIFARTALEIKSSVGALPLPMFGFIHHQSSVVHQLLPVIFNYLEPKVEWQQRSPFKELPLSFAQAGC